MVPSVLVVSATLCMVISLTARTRLHLTSTYNHNAIPANSAMQTLYVFILNSHNFYKNDKCLVWALVVLGFSLLICQTNWSLLTIIKKCINYLCDFIYFNVLFLYLPKFSFLSSLWADSIRSCFVQDLCDDHPVCQGNGCHPDLCSSRRTPLLPTTALWEEI